MDLIETVVPSLLDWVEDEIFSEIRNAVITIGIIVIGKLFIWPKILDLWDWINRRN